MIKYSKKRKGETFMKVDYIEIRESVLPKSKGSKFRKGAVKHLAVLVTALIICIGVLFCLNLSEIGAGFGLFIIVLLLSPYYGYISENFLERSYKLHWNYDRFSETLAQYGIDDPDAFAKNVEILEEYFRFRGSEAEIRDEVNRLLGIFYGEVQAKEDDEKLLGMLKRGEGNEK